MQQLRAEDPTLRAKTEERTGETTVYGMGERHLEVIVERLHHEFGVEATIGTPEVLYKEGLTSAASGEGRYVRQTAGRGQYGHVKIHLEPGAPGSGYVFAPTFIGHVIPREFIAPIQQGIEEALTHGPLAGYPVEDVRIELWDGTYHAVDSSETAFRIAAWMAFQNAAKHAGPCCSSQ